MTEEMPFYPLPLWGEPMYCVCDLAGCEEADFCEKCPRRAEHREAASAELALRQTRAMD